MKSANTTTSIKTDETESSLSPALCSSHQGNAHQPICHDFSPPHHRSPTGKPLTPMDVHFRAYKVHSAKHFSTVQAARIHTDSHVMFGDSDGEDDARACFPCPFCYVDIDLSMLCSHLQEDHCFDLKNAVCPLCAANLGKDVTGHFIVQHASSLKRRKKSEKSGFLTGNSARLGKKFPTNAVGNKPESAPDPLLSLFINNNMQFLDPKCIQQDECFRDDASDTSDVKSMEPSPLDEGHEQDNEERRQKAAFVQQLIMSTIF